MIINLLNFSYGNNYGAILQAYALQEALKKRNHNVYTIKTIPQKSICTRCMKYIFLFFADPWCRRKYMRKIHTMFHRSIFSVNNSRYDTLANSALKDSREGLIIFDNTVVCSTLSDYQRLSRADAVICGSDVIWQCESYSTAIDIYFLSWVQPDAARIAYAPSWGSPNIKHLNKRTQQKISKYLAKFDAVSVREKSGVDICASLGRADAKWVPDPTMLLTTKEWDKIAESAFDGDYCLNYHIPYNASVDDVKILSSLFSYFNLPIKSIPDLNSENVWVSPTKWLGAIRDARFVVTNSFHGVVLCLLYHKHFVFTELIGEYKHLNERIYSLLELFELKDRIATPVIASNDAAIKEILKAQIDWQTIDVKMQAWRQVGIDFLDEALKKAAQKKKCSES